MNRMLNFQFKGDRNYNQGGDIFSLVDDCCASFGFRVSSLAIKKFTKNNLELFIDESSAPENASGSIVASGKLFGKSGGFHDFFLRDTDIPVKGRREFDEDSIVDKALIDGSGIFLNELTDYSVIEHVIALTKKLSYTLSPLKKGKWVFVQLQLSAPLPPKASNIGIVRESCVADKFSRNRILINNSPYGEIRFAVAEL